MIKESKNLLFRLHNRLFVSNYNNKYKLRKRYLPWLAMNIGYRSIVFLFWIYLSVYRLLRRYPAPLDDTDGKFIVSLTSFPARIGKVWIVIDSLMRQTVRPSKICLYLSDEEFPDGLASLPQRLLNYQQLGLKICFRPYNLMPHIKYLYALQEYPSCDVVTVDDDCYYFPDMIERLVSQHTSHTCCVCSNSVKVICCRHDGTPLPYKEWLCPMYPAGPSLTNVALGSSGVYYPAGVFKSQAVFDLENIRLLALRTDDLWLRIHETLEGIPVAGGGYQFPGFSIIGTQKKALKHNNCSDDENNGNDVAWKRLCNHYTVNYGY